MKGTRLEEWETGLRRALEAVDHTLEDRFAGHFAPRPNRPARHTTANPKYDGLFAVHSKFSLGLMSTSGPGYVIDVDTASAVTLSAVQREAVVEEAERALREALAEAFPKRTLNVQRDGHVLRVTGDLSLR